MAKLSAIVIKNDYFREIVSTQKYECHAVKKVVIRDPPKNNKAKNHNNNHKSVRDSDSSLEHKVKYKKRFF